MPPLPQIMPRICPDQISVDRGMKWEDAYEKSLKLTGTHDGFYLSYKVSLLPEAVRGARAMGRRAGADASSRRAGLAGTSQGLAEARSRGPQESLWAIPKWIIEAALALSHLGSRCAGRSAEKGAGWKFPAPCTRALPVLPAMAATPALRTCLKAGQAGGPQVAAGPGKAVLGLGLLCASCHSQ